MSSVQYALLSLLAREPLSGYDIKQQMNSRFGPFWSINNNQLYPTLAKLEAEGLIELQSHEQTSYRPARKVYAMTEAGREHLKAWVLEPREPESVKDEFILKLYDSWLVDREQMIPLLQERRRQHEERLVAYTAKVAGFREQFPVLQSNHPLFSTLAVIEMGIGYERNYIEWCDRMIEWLRANRA